MLTELSHHISADALYPRGILQSLALCDIRAPQRLVDADGIDRLDTVTQEGLESTLYDLDSTITLLILIEISDLEIAAHLMHMLLVTDTCAHAHMLQSLLHSEHRHDDEISAVFLETLAQSLWRESGLRIYDRLTNVYNQITHNYIAPLIDSNNSAAPLRTFSSTLVPPFSLSPGAFFRS